MEKNLIWTDYKPLLPDLSRLQTQLGDSFRLSSRPDDLDSAHIAFGQPDPAKVIRLQQLKWVQVNTAGYTAYDTAAVRSALTSRGAILTNSSSVYAEPCAEHVVSIILALARKLPESLINQATTRAWPAGQIRSRSQLLVNQTVLLVGFGAIGKRIAELLAPFKVRLVAFRRTPGDNDPIRTIALPQLDEALRQADHVVNILPLTDSTKTFFDESRFAKLKHGAFFYNIGRGDTVDQNALRAALASGQISQAWLDVMTPEPLPPNDPLWTTPNCYISPHTAGGHSNEAERVIGHFVKNLQNFEQGMALADRIV